MKNQNEIAKQSKSMAITYEANGQEVKLSPAIISHFVTKGNGKISQTEAVNFMNLCRYANLNPFLNEAYLIKFGDKPAQMVVGKEAFMKRAFRHPQFNGFKAGITVETSNGEIKQKQGQAVYPNEKLLAGWAEVARKDIDYPIFVETSLSEYSKGQSTWNQMPANMIRKVAVVNAMREAFPEELGALYTEDEPNFEENNKREIIPEEKAETNKLLEGFSLDDNASENIQEMGEVQESPQVQEVEETMESEAFENGNLFEDAEQYIPTEFK